MLYSPWETLNIPVLQGNLDILHISHMWLMKEGVDYAVGQLERVNLHAARCLELARRYGIAHWMDQTIHDLLLMPLMAIIINNIPLAGLGVETFSAIACAKEAIEDNCHKVSVCLPYPKDMDASPYCSDRNHCKAVWFTVWVHEICRLVHRNHVRYVPLCNLPDYFWSLPIIGMHADCKDFVLDLPTMANAGILLEEELIQKSVQGISDL